MTTTTRVAVHASEPIILAGITSYLHSCAEMTTTPMISGTPQPGTDVLVFATERVNSENLGLMRRWNKLTEAPIVLVTGELQDVDLLTIVECRVMSLLPRGTTTGDRLLQAVQATAAGNGMVPPALLGKLLRRVERLQRDVLGPSGLHTSGLTPREVEVLRLMSEGLDTNDISDLLCYSERAVKNVIYGITTKLKLRNRAHAVAYALREGII